MSVNKAWQGRRFKTAEYKAYESAVLALLPDAVIPDGPLHVTFEFGFSNMQSDIDNPVKPFMDCLQKRYGFNDNRVERMVLSKVKVPKGAEYIDFAIMAS